jgi:hypothetical protein
MKLGTGPLYLALWAPVPLHTHIQTQAAWPLAGVDWGQCSAALCNVGAGAAGLMLPPGKGAMASQANYISERKFGRWLGGEIFLKAKQLEPKAERSHLEPSTRSPSHGVLPIETQTSLPLGPKRYIFDDFLPMNMPRHLLPP